MEGDWSDDLDAALEEQLKLIRQFKIPGEEVNKCRSGGSISRVMCHPELSRISQGSIMIDECCCAGSNSRVIRHSGLNQGVQHTEETEKIYHKNSTTEISMEDDVDAGLEQRLRLIRQSDRSDKSSNEVKEEALDACPCSSINSRVMRHPELNGMCPCPRPSFRPGPNGAFVKSLLLPLEIQGYLEWIGIVAGVQGQS